MRAHGASRAGTIAFLLSALIHAGLLAVVDLPRPDPRVRADDGWELQQVELPPRVEVPSAPGPIARPSPPSVTEVAVESPAARGEASGGGAVDVPLPQPPKVRATTLSGRPAVVPHEVPPMLEGRDRFRRRLARSYPLGLQRRGVEGVVELRFHVDDRGEVSRVEVARSSGHRGLDRAARRVADRMQFLPALNRERAVGVWVSQKICFVADEEDDESTVLGECGGELVVESR